MRHLLHEGGNKVSEHLDPLHAPAEAIQGSRSEACQLLHPLMLNSACKLKYYCWVSFDSPRKGGVTDEVSDLEVQYMPAQCKIIT